MQAHALVHNMSHFHEKGKAFAVINYKKLSKTDHYLETNYIKGNWILDMFISKSMQYINLAMKCEQQ